DRAAAPGGSEHAALTLQAGVISAEEPDEDRVISALGGDGGGVGVIDAGDRVSGLGIGGQVVPADGVDWVRDGLRGEIGGAGVPVGVVGECEGDWRIE